MGYYIDISTISLGTYKVNLEKAYLPPSRLILKDRLNERFQQFQELGIKNVDELRQTLRNKNKRFELAKEYFFSEEYLKILLRELNSIHPKPNKIKDFPGISKDISCKLEKLGITNTQKLFERVLNKIERNRLATDASISIEKIIELTKLTDLSRIKWVGVNFARMLYDLGIDTVEKASKSNPIKLHLKINKINKEKNYYKGTIGLNDIRIFVEVAKEVPLEIEY